MFFQQLSRALRIAGESRSISVLARQPLRSKSSMASTFLQQGERKPTSLKDRAFEAYHAGRFEEALKAAEDWRDQSFRTKDLMSAKSLIVRIVLAQEAQENSLKCKR